MPRVARIELLTSAASAEEPLGVFVSIPPQASLVQRIGGSRVAFTTDSYVVKPLFFPGGDIGRLAVFGTVNDLAMCGARPLALSAGFILEADRDALMARSDPTRVPN